MKTKITLELRNKIRRDMLIVKDQYFADGLGDYCGILSFDRDKESELFEECIMWREMIDTYYRTSYNAGKAKRVGRFSGVKPKKIHLHSIEFAISGYDNPSWKDWFDMEGKEDNPNLINSYYYKGDS
jgi:hypothetical protein